MSQSAEVRENLQVLKQTPLLCQWRCVLDRRRGRPGLHIHPRERLRSPEEVHARRGHPHLNGVAAAVGNFTKWGGALLPERPCSLLDMAGSCVDLPCISIPLLTELRFSLRKANAVRAMGLPLAGGPPAGLLPFKLATPDFMLGASMIMHQGSIRRVWLLMSMYSL